LIIIAVSYTGLLVYKRT